MKVAKVDASRYAFDFGGGTETIAVDGAQHAAGAGTTLSVAAEGSRWKVIRKKGGRVLLTATWSLSKDGNVLNDDFTAFSQNGSTSHIKYRYSRRTAGSGFAGTWVSNAAAPSSLIVLHARSYGTDGISLMFPSQTLNVKFDGKSARRLNARTVEILPKSKGEIVRRRRIEVSPDLKTLTMTVHLAGQRVPYTYIFKRS